MVIKNKKEITLYSIFLKYLVSFCLLTTVLLFLVVSIFAIGLNTEVLLPANYAQNQLEEVRKELIDEEQFNENKIKYPYKYSFYDNDFKLISSNFSKRQLEESNKYLEGKKFKTNKVYTKIDLKDGTCIISYDIKAHFSLEYWNNIFPHPEIMGIILFFILFIIMCIILIRKFGKSLRKELYVLKQSTERIMEQDLDFEIVPTNVKEFNNVLTSIDNMKSALKESLETQWELEQKKKEQISALAHDIKTPLTIIKGNAELLLESEFLNEDGEYVRFIIKNTDKIEKYISLLMDISKADNDVEYAMEKIEFNDFLEELVYETKMIGKTKNITTLIKVNNKIKSFEGNRNLLIRALINIIINSIDYSPIGGEIEISVNINNNKLKFTVKDCGKGFTKQGLINATNQFYMEKSERRVGKHYGIGLYIAQTIAKKHGGELELKNRKDKEGAEVSLSIFQQYV
ncbi:sensor histidine kinase [Clostridium tarantellae]|uniref:histidine kinase n=1 Tax=Clostridium tarantellae TaxID=39493 RepID=A0A6I1MKM7_9CLOT|nr:HAMP domain-containing sensor histidine kinase [Clostridium tarantellae]MPQ43524.1 sensor histidine kinase [Clostridium tarantellae]